MNLKEIIKGILTYVPGLYNPKRGSTGGTNSARYCYSVWLRHLILAHQNGLCIQPRVVAELGPGDSLGTGLAALLSGAEKYYALDVVEYADSAANLDIFEELISLFNERTPIPDEQEFPAVRPLLQSYEFPHNILRKTHLEWALAPERIRLIRQALVEPDTHTANPIGIRYFVPWDDAGVIRKGSVDMIFSQAVLEHVEDLCSTYGTLYRWLNRGGFMSHQIDMSSHDRATRWNGHWAYSDLTWKLIKGRRPYLINRQPYSMHRLLLSKSGFEIAFEQKTSDISGIMRKQLASAFRDISEDDLTTRTVHVLARKNV